MILYKLTARRPLIYRLGEPPTGKEGFRIRTGKTLTLSEEGMRIVHVYRADTLAACDPDDYQLTMTDLVALAGQSINRE